MDMSWNPRLPEVASLLEECGLPSDDILPEYLSSFVIAREGNDDLGVAGLQLLGTSALVRSIGVAKTHRSRGLGTALLAAVEAKARSQGVVQLYLLTNDAQQFFAKHGYTEVSRSSAPAEIQNCSQFGSSCCGAATLMRKPAGA
jgi:amino-acid N-acetyltransferase